MQAIKKIMFQLITRIDFEFKFNIVLFFKHFINRNRNYIYQRYVIDNYADTYAGQFPAYILCDSSAELQWIQLT